MLMAIGAWHRSYSLSTLKVQINIRVPSRMSSNLAEVCCSLRVLSEVFLCGKHPAPKDSTKYSAVWVNIKKQKLYKYSALKIQLIKTFAYCQVSVWFLKVNECVRELIYIFIMILSNKKTQLMQRMQVSFSLEQKSHKTLVCGSLFSCEDHSALYPHFIIASCKEIFVKNYHTNESIVGKRFYYLVAFLSAAQIQFLSMVLQKANPEKQSSYMNFLILHTESVMNLSV